MVPSIFSFSWQHFSNSLYKLFLFYIIGALLNIAKLHNFLKSLHCYHITISKFWSQRESHNLFVSSQNIILQWNFLLTTMVAALLIVCSILQCKMNQSDSYSACPDDEFICLLLNQLLIECPSDTLDTF